MKKNISIYIIFLLISNIAFSQQINGEISYKVNITEAFTMIDKEKLKTIPPAYLDDIKKSMSDLEQRIKLNIKSIETNLSFNQQEAIYIPISGMDNDGDRGLKETMIITGSYGKYYFNKVLNKRIRQIDVYGQLFLIESDLNSRQWVLTQETKTINDYLCYKATSTLVTNNSAGTFYKPLIAWYAQKLPIPYGYGGLPGLILQLTEGDFIFYVSKLILNPKNPNKIEQPTKGKKVTEDKFEAIGLQSSPKFRN